MGQRKTDKYRIKENRGIGRDLDYKPWIKVHEFGSLGRVHRVKGWKSPRIYQLMSDLEYYYFLSIQFRDDVVDIREQFPLLPLEQTEAIAADLGVIHPPQWQQEKKVMTTDFVITISNDGKKEDIAIAIKCAADEEKSRTQEKLAIEREYWKRMGIEFHIVTEKDILKKFAQNIAYIYQGYFWQKDMSYSNEYIEELIYKLNKLLIESNQRLIVALRQLEKDENWQLGEGNNFVKFLLATKKATTDFEDKINFMKMKIRFNGENTYEF